MISQQELQQLFQYRDGNLYWNVARPRIRAGNKAGCVNHTTGYEMIGIDGRIYRTHRLVFLMLNGYLPKEIDHINGIKTDNRIENLREVTHSQNCYNIKKRTNNTSGVMNVSWHKPYSKWTVRIRVNGKPKNFGYFDDLELAQLVAIEAKDKYHKEFANHGH